MTYSNTRFRMKTILAILALSIVAAFMASTASAGTFKTGKDCGTVGGYATCSLTGYNITTKAYARFSADGSGVNHCARRGSEGWGSSCTSSTHSYSTPTANVTSYSYGLNNTNTSHHYVLQQYQGTY